jgi:hypothetical protein
VRVDGRWPGGQSAAEVVGVRVRAGVPELRRDAAAQGVHHAGDPAPRGLLPVGVEARDAAEADGALAHPGALGDDQAGGRVAGYDVIAGPARLAQLELAVLD